MIIRHAFSGLGRGRWNGLLKDTEPLGERYIYEIQWKLSKRIYFNISDMDKLPGLKAHLGFFLLFFFFLQASKYELIILNL